MTTYVQDDVKGEAGKPWIGFAVRGLRGKTGVYVCDVAEGGPADIAGLRDDDQLISFADVQCDDMKTFRNAMRKHKKPGKKVTVVGRRGRDDEFRVTLKVGVKKRIVVEDVPSIDTLKDLSIVLKDPVKLDKLSQAAFAAADADCSGLVTKTEFQEAMRTWLSPDASNFISDFELSEVFEQCDADGSGYLRQREFPILVQTMLLDMVKNMNSASDEIFATALGPEKPWLGFTIRKPREHKELFIEDIEEGGPAQFAGLATGDQLVSIASHKMATLESFHEFMNKRIRFDLPLAIRFRRFGKLYTTRLVIGKRGSVVYKNIKASYTQEEITTICSDPVSFEAVADHLFQKVDSKHIGIIDCRRLLPELSVWGSLGHHITEEVLLEAMSLLDFDESGYITKKQFLMLLKTLVSVIHKWQEASKVHKMTVRRQKYLDPVPTATIFQRWHSRGYFGGTFHTDNYQELVRTTNEQHWPHILVAVSDSLVIKKFGAQPQEEILQPGDEIFIPPGCVYQVHAHSDADRFMFAVCAGHPAKDARMEISFLHKEIQPASERHISLGFRVAADPQSDMLKISWMASSDFEAEYGVQVGDSLVSINDSPVKTRKEFQDACGCCVLGQDIRIQVLHDEEPLNFFTTALASRHALYFSDDTVVPSAEEVEALLQDKKKSKHFATLCFAACDPKGRGIVDRDSFDQMFMTQLGIPESLGHNFPKEDLLKMFDKADKGAASYLTATEFRRLLVQVLEQIHANAAATVVKVQPAPPPEAVLVPMPERKPAKSKKRAQQKVQRPSTRKVTVKRSTTKPKAKPVARRTSRVVKKKVRRDRDSDNGSQTLSPWNTKKTGKTQHTNGTTEVSRRTVPRSKVAAMALKQA